MAELVTLGFQVGDWIEHYLHHGPGDVEGQPVVLDDERFAFILKCYRLRPRPRCVECGTVAPASALEEAPWRCPKCKSYLLVRRMFDEVLLSRPKGWAKSEIAGFLGCAEALAPVRFDGWDADGQPVARPVTRPFIRCLATEESQSGNTFGNIAFMLHPDTSTEVLRLDYPGIDAGRDAQTSTRIYLPQGGEVRPSTASSAAKDGGKESFTVEDEPHLWYTSELRSMHSTVHRNGFKRKAAEPWMLGTSTYYRPGQGSIMEDFVSAVERGNAPQLLLDHRQASRSIEEILAGDDPDPDEVVELLGEAFGDAALFLDLEHMAEGAISGRYDEVDRYLGNRPTTHSDDWADVGAWDDRAREQTSSGEARQLGPPPDGLRITVGFDGSYGTSDERVPDSTVLRGVVLEDGPWSGYVFTIGMWEADGDPDWEPPFDEVDVTVDETFGRWDVWRLHADPAYWRDRIRGWKARHGEDRVIEWATNRDRQMAHALEDLHVALHGRTSELTHDGDPRVRAHYGNARTQVKKARVESADPEGKKELVLVRKETPRSARKIDTVVTDAIAWAARGDGIAAGAHIVKRKVKAYGF